MLKFTIALCVAAVSVAVYCATGEITPAIVALIGGVLGAIIGFRPWRKPTVEVTSDPIPTFIPASMDPYDAAERRHREMLLKKSEPVIDEDGEVLPPPPNVGEDGVPYNGPHYFDRDQFFKG